MADTHPGDTERLHEYWVHGEGAAKIRWGAPGDFQRCVDHLGKYIDDPQGYCNLAHHAALGIYPATHAKELRGRSGTVAKYTQAQIDALGAKGHAFKNPDGHFSYPVDDAEDLSNAIGAVGRGNASHDAIRAYIVRRAKEMGKSSMIPDNWSASGSNDADDSSRAETFAQSGPYYRSFPLEDIHVRSGGDGRTVEAYAAVFGVPAKVKDQDGTYMEEIDPAAFNRAISDAAPHGSRRSWKVGVFYNHGMTLWGTPSEKHSFPVGVPLDIAVDGHGLKTVTRYHRGEFCDQILEAIREGSIGGYSFTGDFKRSTPQVPRGGFRPNYRTGDLPMVRRLESTLMEYGPTPVPVYEGATVTAMRAMNSNPELAMQMLSMFRDGAPEDSPPQTGAPETGLAAEDSPSRRSGRSVKQEIQAARSEFLQRYRR